MVEHELAIMDEFCDPVIVMAEGTVLASRTMRPCGPVPRWWRLTLSDEPALRAEDVRAGYGAGDIIHGVSVSVAPRTVASVVGPNGSGKSTLMKALTGVVRLFSAGCSSATATYHRCLAPEEIARAPGVGYVPQIDDVFALLTVKENLEMGGYLLPGREVSARIDHVVSVFPRLGQMLTRRAGRLSGGERKMLAMGRVLMLQPAVFLLDEPTANLAPQGGGRTAQRARPGAGRSRRRGARRRAAGQGRARHLRLHLRARGGQVLMEDTPARLSASQEFTESFFGAVPQSPK